MAADWTVKRNDWGTSQPLRVTLLTEVINEAGEVEEEGGVPVLKPIDLTEASAVHLYMRSKTLLIKAGPMAFVNKEGGQVEYDFQPEEEGDPADTATAGEYRLEFEITWKGGGGVQTVPNDSYLSLEIVEDLGP